MTAGRRNPSWKEKAGQVALLLLALILAALGLSLIVGAVSQARMVFSLNASSAEEEATVVRIDTSRLPDSAGNSTRTMSLPVMEFRYMGHSYEFTAQAVRGDRKFTVGEKVQVVFPPGRPEQAVLSEFRHSSWAVYLFMGLALFTVPTSLLGWVVWEMRKGNF